MNKMIINIKKKNKIYMIFLWSKLIIFYLYYSIILSLFSNKIINNKKVMIINYYGKGYGDMGKYICNELLKDDYKVYWATEKKYIESLPKKVQYVKFDSIKYLYHISTSKVLINNSRFRFGMRKRNGQFYIQAWHGCIGYKKAEYAAEKALTKPYILGAKNDSKMADLFISNSDFFTKNIKDNFWYNGEILECGCPRNDIIVNHDKSVVKHIKNCFKIDDNDKICLYAPTFRVDSSLNHYDIDYEKLIKSLESRFKGKWKVLIRLHPNISKLSNDLIKKNSNIINATDYPDMQELLVAADFMITDYSSCIFDYAISKKNAVIYASDIEEYIKDRDFLFDIKDTPFSIATNNNELENIINNYDEDKYKSKVDKFYKKMGLKETGKSCKKIVEIINKITGNEGK